MPALSGTPSLPPPPNVANKAKNSGGSAYYLNASVSFRERIFENSNETRYYR